MQQTGKLQVLREAIAVGRASGPGLSEEEVFDKQETRRQTMVEQTGDAAALYTAIQGRSELDARHTPGRFVDRIHPAQGLLTPEKHFVIYRAFSGGR